MQTTKESHCVYKIDSRNGMLVFGMVVASIPVVLVWLIWLPLGILLLSLYACFLYWVFKRFSLSLLLYDSHITINYSRFGKRMVEQIPLDKIVEIESIHTGGRHRTLVLKIQMENAIEKFDLGYPTAECVSELYELLKHLVDLGISIKLTTTESSGVVQVQLKRVNMCGKVVNIKYLSTTYSLEKMNSNN